jgi:hypothetical protein
VAPVQGAWFLALADLGLGSSRRLALALVCADLDEGRRRIHIYRQFKMDNDPALNPELYNRG